MKRAREDDEPPLAKYEIGKILGEGSFATVRLGQRKADGARFAVKLIDRSSMSLDEAKREADILATLGLHRHIVSLIEQFELPKSSVFVMELAEGGEVFDRICEEGAYSEADAASVLRQVALALAFMHSIGVVHRDLKPENLLLTSTNDVKVADFGLAAYVGGEGRPPLTEVCGTIAYMAPEMIAALKPRGGHPPKPYGAEVDLFSLGGILFALLGAYTPFDPNNDQSDEGIQERITKGQWGFDDFPDQWNHVSSGAKDLLRLLLEPTPSQRITADALLRNGWASGAEASEAPLPGSSAQLQRFNGGRKVWRAAVHATALFLKSPATAAHTAEATVPVPAEAATVSGASAPPAKLPPLVLAELHAAFSLFDIDQNGAIDAEEMRQVVRSLGAKESDAARLLAEADADGDGLISFDEFAALVRPIYDESCTALKHAFEMFDTDGSGYIDRSELSVMLRKLGFGWQGAHVFSAADADGDGKVDFAEFVAIFGKKASAAAAAAPSSS